MSLKISQVAYLLEARYRQSVQMKTKIVQIRTSNLSYKLQTATERAILEPVTMVEVMAAVEMAVVEIMEAIHDDLLLLQQAIIVVHELL